MLMFMVFFYLVSLFFGISKMIFLELVVKRDFMIESILSFFLVEMLFDVIMVIKEVWLSFNVVLVSELIVLLILLFKSDFIGFCLSSFLSC